jgi:hypothetical protein
MYVTNSGPKRSRVAIYFQRFDAGQAAIESAVFINISCCAGQFFLSAIGKLHL